MKNKERKRQRKGIRERKIEREKKVTNYPAQFKPTDSTV